MPSSATETATASSTSGLKRFFPRVDTPAYHVMLAVVAMLVLGPLGGISAAYMNFSIGFFLGGHLLAGILGSTVTLPYGPEGRHGGNYLQTMSASVAGMCGLGVLMQAMIWLNLPEPPVWEIILYFTCIGMFGVGVGMLYTPVVVDRMQLAFPSGFAVANILRALTDKDLLKKSILKLGGGIVGGYALAMLLIWAAFLEKLHGLLSFLFSHLPGLSLKGSLLATNSMNLITAFSASTFGAGMIVGARIALPALMVGGLGELFTPRLVEMGWLAPAAPFRQIGFIIALGMILGAAVLDVGLVLLQTVQRLRRPAARVVEPPPDWKRVNIFRLVLWVIFWGAGVVVVGSRVLHQPLFFLIAAVLLSFLFVLVNGISIGISDSNPISSAFVMTVFIFAALGLKSPGIGLMCASILLIACSEGGDMQQDRSTGWRLGTNRVVQFRYQVIGIAMGAVLAVVLAKIFMTAYPVLRVDQFSHPHVKGAQQWTSAMTYKFVGALKDITNPQPHVMTALRLGIVLGLLIEIARKLLKRSRRYREFSSRSKFGAATSFLLDSFFLPSPYASSFGGFVPFLTTIWWSAGGVFASVYNSLQARRKSRAPKPASGAVPADMSTMSLVGGGLIAGDSLAALTIGICGLLHTLLHAR